MEAAEIQDRFNEVYDLVANESGIRFAFEREDRQKHVNSYTFYLRYDGPLPAPNNVKVDITLDEVLVFPVERLPVLQAYEEFQDLPKDRRIAVYSLNEIATEKVVALQDRARNEPRDLYDLWYLTTHAGIALGDLVGSITEKLQFRGQALEGLERRILEKEARLQFLWRGRLEHQMDVIPGFSDVFRAIRRELRQADLPQ
jgi:predicted nucleotidyltransferase component of viral defense system